MQTELTLEELEQILDLLETVRAPLDLCQKIENAIDYIKDQEELEKYGLDS